MTTLCDFIDDNYRSDVAVEEVPDAYLIVVAAMRYAPPPPMPPVLSGQAPGWEAQVRVFVDAAAAWLAERQTRPVTLPLAGAVITVPDARECLLQLRRLEAMGYHVPQVVIDRLCWRLAQAEP